MYLKQEAHYIIEVISHLGSGRIGGRLCKTNLRTDGGGGGRYLELENDDPYHAQSEGRVPGHDVGSVDVHQLQALALEEAQRYSHVLQSLQGGVRAPGPALRLCSLKYFLVFRVAEYVHAYACRQS